LRHLHLAQQSDKGHLQLGKPSVIGGRLIVMPALPQANTGSILLKSNMVLVCKKILPE
jgi:hypothetical protein